MLFGITRGVRARPSVSLQRCRAISPNDLGVARHARARFLGLDLAWSERNRSGLAALDERGAVLEVRADLTSDAEILAWIRTHAADAAGDGDALALGVDMATIVRNGAGFRPCERAVRAVFARHHAGPHASNLGRFPDGGRAARMLRDLAIGERLDLAPRTPGRFAFEVFPHPALVRLFDRDRIFRSKKKPGRAWDVVLAEWSDYRRALASLHDADPPLALPATFPHSVEAAGYKRWDDAIDAIACAYIASFVWHHGMPSPHVTAFGDLESGYIVVPNRRVFAETAGPEREGRADGDDVDLR